MRDCVRAFPAPFWTFFGATFIGKALIKVNLQATFFIMLFSEKLLMRVISSLSILGKWGLDETVREFLLNQKAKFHSDGDRSAGEEPPLLARLWGLFMVGFILMFAKSIVDSFAQQRAGEIHAADIDELEQKKGKCT